MAKSRILLLSNSTMPGQPYMEWSKTLITEFLTSFHVKEILFIPFAGVRLEWDDYSKLVENALTNFKVTPIHKYKNFIDAVNNAQAIMIGGGNTFHLLEKLYEYKLLTPIRERIQGLNQIPYIGWSAGSNVAGPDIGSTNDMPIIWPPSDKSLNLVPYNLNPHYNEWKPENFNGESRIDRLNECVLIKKRPIVAYAEGVAIRIENGIHQLIAPSMDKKYFHEDIDKRCVKIWNFTDKICVESIPLTAQLNSFIPDLSN